MSRRPLTMNQIEKKLANGCGSGWGMDYIPYLKVQNVASCTLVFRMRGLKIRRIYHLLSFLEVCCFHVLDNCACIVDIREQFPLLTLTNTLNLARRLKVAHPGLYRGAMTPQVMTTDFLIDLVDEGKLRLVAICVKPAALLRDKRTREKLELERFYWLERGVDWWLITENEIPMDLVRNLQWIYATRNWYSDKPPYDLKLLLSVEEQLFKSLNNSMLPMSYTLLGNDRELGFKPGTCLDIFRYFVAMRFWNVDLFSLIDTAKSISVIRSLNFNLESEVDVNYNCDKIYN